jgi:archaemetzincin
LDSKSILLIAHGQFEDYFLETIAEDIKSEYHCGSKIVESHADLSEFYDPKRRQYDGNKILKSLDSIDDPKVLKTVGLFRVDLFIPILTYIFGQAIFNGKTGIASIYRLKNEQYGIEVDDDLMLDRFRKVVIHELGHTFGLIHCYVPSCVMRISTYVEDIDQKKLHLCSDCYEKLALQAK